MTESFNDSPFRDSYGLGMFVMAACSAPAAVQTALVGGDVKWIVAASLGLLVIALSSQCRWLIRNDRWFRTTSVFNLTVQVVSMVVAWVVGNKWVAAAGGGVGVLLGGFFSLPWQSRLRAAHHIPTRFIDKRPGEY